MGNHFNKHLIFFVLMFFWEICTASAQQDRQFLECMSKRSGSKINLFIHTFNSPEYSKLLKNAEKIGRWLNSTSTKPLLIVAPDVEDQVEATIICSKQIGLRIRVKSGGHDYEGLSYRSINKFIMIDLVNLKNIIINLVEETAWIQTGVTLGELYYAIWQKSNVHAFAGGLYPTVGSGGHISGGGQGMILRKYGLASDNVMDARIADVNGQILDRKFMGEDLFWALRGGGGSSFGVILAWKLKLVRVPEEVTAFTVRRKLKADTIMLLQKWQTISHQMPEDLFMRAYVQNKKQNIPGEDKIAQISYQGLFLGKAKDFIPLMKQTFPEFELEISDCLRPPSKPLNCQAQPCVRKECFQVSWIKSVLYFAGQSVNTNVTYLVDANTIQTPPSFYKAKSDFLARPIPEEGWEILKQAFLEEESPMILLDTYGGIMGKIPADETAFPHRDGSTHNVQYIVKWKNNEDGEVKKRLEWMTNLYKKMEPFVLSNPRAAYINYKDLDLGQNSESFSYGDAKEWGRKYFKGNFARLAEIKSRVDPTNFFRNEQSIPPLVV